MHRDKPKGEAMQRRFRSARRSRETGVHPQEAEWKEDAEPTEGSCVRERVC